MVKNQRNSCCHMGCPPMIERLHFHRGYSLRLHKSKPFINYGIIRLKHEGIQISMDGRGRALDNVFVERLWRTVKYEEVYLKDYETPREAMQGLGTFFVRYNEWRQHQALGYQTPASVYFGSYL